VDSAGQPFVKARVRAAPEDGAANAALCALIAKTVGRPKSAVSVVRGATARLKHLWIDTPEPSAALAALAAATGAEP
jgi:hypothetical protein